MEALLNLIFKNTTENWTLEAKEAIHSVFGSGSGRYPETNQKLFSLRNPESKAMKVPFTALIHPSNPDSGGYGGMSLVFFPVEGSKPLVAFVVGTQGISPDEMILGKPGHKRKLNAICSFLNQKAKTQDRLVAWNKFDPLRIDIDSKPILKEYPEYQDIFSTYGNVIYAFFVPRDDKKFNEEAIKLFLDFYMEERGGSVLKNVSKEFIDLKSQYLNHLFVQYTEKDIYNILKNRRFLILQGPPGTGKTRLGNHLLKNFFSGNGEVFQFHANVSYENFIGGLFPEPKSSEMGFQFRPKKGALLEAIEKANQNPKKDYLLYIDEINRADLSKVLGEAIYLFEEKDIQDREVKLNYDFAGSIGTNLKIPENFYLLGSMNTADKSIASIDLAIRRRFGFIDIWPDLSVVQNELMRKFFNELIEIFLDFANEDSFSIIPGHSYFLETKNPISFLKMNLLPLLQEYRAQGLVLSFVDKLDSYMQKIANLKEA
ncbi:MAG: AAA family ATPase [Leptospiraceae bacterium]|nr:AAA family ATPase [Leptospiraceae bacterium]MCP5501063.1 AAA family ATPase [Leptospiraceae bacterium]